MRGNLILDIALVNCSAHVVDSCVRPQPAKRTPWAGFVDSEYWHLPAHAWCLGRCFRRRESDRVIPRARANHKE